MDWSLEPVLVADWEPATVVRVLEEVRVFWSVVEVLLVVCSVVVVAVDLVSVEPVERLTEDPF